VEVPLEPSPFGIRGLHDPGPGRAHLRELAAKILLETFVVHGKAHDGLQRPHHVRVVEEQGVVDNRAADTAVRLEDRRGATGLGRG